MPLIRPNSDLEAQERKALSEKEAASRPTLSMLAAHIQSAFETAKQHRQTSGVTDRLLTSKRLKQGEYDPEKLARIRSVGSSELFYNITEPKCESFVAWMTDVFNSSSDKPWGIDPTPIPSLSADETEKIQQAVVEQFAPDAEAGEIDPELVKAYAHDLYDEALKAKAEEAKERCDRMSRLIEDQTEEGGFMDALAEFFTDLADYPSAILKGPVFNKKKRLSWKEGAINVQEEVIPTWTTVSPFNFYPGPNAKTVDGSYICEVIDFDRGDLANMRGVPGWNTQAINEAIQFADLSNAAALPGESEMRRYENKETLYTGNQYDATIRAIEYWGSVQGALLRQWGMSEAEIPEPNSFYQVCCILVNHRVVRAVLNPDPLGKKPYYVTSFIKNKNSLWGSKSIPEKVSDCQDGVNVAQRNLMNNLAFGAGPQVAADLDAIPAAHIPTLNQQYPMKVWAFHGQKAQGSRAPIDFFQPDTRATELMAVAEFFERQADDRTLIPRYVTGDQDMTGAGATASGLSMLMNAASRGIKRVIRNVDLDVVRPAIRAMYVYNMLHHADDSVKGDAQVVPRGAVGMLGREQAQLRRQEFLAITNNPTDLQIIDLERRAALLREVAKTLNLEKDKVVPSEEEMRTRIQSQQAIQQQAPTQ